MNNLRILCTLAIVCISSFVSLSQTQSLWSQIKKDKSDIVGLNALQYQAPLWGPQISFFDQNVVKWTRRINWAAPGGLLTSLFTILQIDHLSCFFGR